MFFERLAYSVEYITHVPYYDDTLIAFVRKDMEIVIFQLYHNCQIYC